MVFDSVYRFIDGWYEINGRELKFLLSANFNISFTNEDRFLIYNDGEKVTKIIFGIKKCKVDIIKFCYDNIPLVTDIKMNKTKLILEFRSRENITIY